MSEHCRFVESIDCLLADPTWLETPYYFVNSSLCSIRRFHCSVYTIDKGYALVHYNEY